MLVMRDWTSQKPFDEGEDNVDGAHATREVESRNSITELIVAARKPGINPTEAKLGLSCPLPLSKSLVIQY